jgi:electron transfer flavoprotein alpha subunit
MQRDVVIVAEHRGNEIESVTYQMLGVGRELANGLGGELLALVTGHEVSSITEKLRDKDVDKIIVVDEPALSQAGAEAHSYVVAEAARRTQARLVLIGYTLMGMELAPAVAAKLSAPAMTNCVAIELRDKSLLVTRPLFDGTMHAQILLDDSVPAVVALQKGMTPPVRSSAKAAPVTALHIDLEAMSFRSTLLEVIEEPSTGIDVSKADVVVSIGRGIGDKEKLSLIQALADALGGVMACSRPVVDVGWLPRDRQVGSSGKTVAPKVYIACGISGASQHLSGMSESKRIIAINKDANAPIFQVAHYGVVADLFEIVPALTAAAKNDSERKIQ